jgi:hypothetical protein
MKLDIVYIVCIGVVYCTIDSFIGLCFIVERTSVKGGRIATNTLTLALCFDVNTSVTYLSSSLL